MAREDIDLQRFVMLNMDGEHHDRLRAGSSPAVSPLRPSIVCATNSITAPRTSPRRRPRAGGGDFVEQVACELPLQAIADLLGVPQDDREKLFRWSNEMTGNDDWN